VGGVCSNNLMMTQWVGGCFSRVSKTCEKPIPFPSPPDYSSPTIYSSPLKPQTRPSTKVGQNGVKFPSFPKLSDTGKFQGVSSPEFPRIPLISTGHPWPDWTPDGWTDFRSLVINHWTHRPVYLGWNLGPQGISQPIWYPLVKPDVPDSRFWWDSMTRGDITGQYYPPLSKKRCHRLKTFNRSSKINPQHWEKWGKSKRNEVFLKVHQISCCTKKYRIEPKTTTIDNVNRPRQ
jgi:hypothetical protein